MYRVATVRRPRILLFSLLFFLPAAAWAQSSSGDYDNDGVRDVEEILLGTATDCNGNAYPDDCELAKGWLDDCDNSGIADICEIADGALADCDNSGAADSCELAEGLLDDCDGGGVPDVCEADCNCNGVDDAADIAQGLETDCDLNGVPDACDMAIEFTFHELPTTTQSSTYFQSAISVELGDIDGDGDLDVVASSPDGIAWAENLGGGVFDDPHLVAQDDLGFVQLGDLDSDGDLDLVVQSYNGDPWGLSVYENTDGAGTFVQHGATLDIVQGFHTEMVLADLDGDGDPDLLRTTFDVWDPDGLDAVVWHPNEDGQGGFGDAIVLETAPLVEDDYYTHALALDLDRDGDNDIVTGGIYGGEGQTRWFENVDGLGSFAPRGSLVAGGLYKMRAADLDGDGDLDLVGGKESLAWTENLGGYGTFGPMQPFGSEPIANHWLETLDMDGDGDIDIAVIAYATQIEEWAWYENIDGQGTFGQRKIAPLYERAYAVYEPVRFGDLDDDGDPDAFFHLDWVWHENLTADCDGNGLVDSCGDPDCDLNGVADACELRDSVAMDCDGNSVPDTCDAVCTVDCNPDADVCLDEFDCAPGDPAIWSEPSPARNLIFHGTTPSRLTWFPPAWPGATEVRFDLLRSGDASDFSAATCLVSDSLLMEGEDANAPPPGELWLYLVRAFSGCAGSEGTLGNGSAGLARVGPTCL